jgi:hypothetical protein
MGLGTPASGHVPRRAASERLADAVRPERTSSIVTVYEVDCAVGQTWWRLSVEPSSHANV